MAGNANNISQNQLKDIVSEIIKIVKSFPRKNS